MDKPKKYIFSDEYNLFLAWGIPLVGLAVMALGIGIALVATEVTISELILPCGALGSFWLIWIVFWVFVIWIHFIDDKRAIDRMFAEGIWEHWQFRAPEWQAIVDAECNLISPEGEGLKAHVGAVYSSIFGIILAIVMIVGGKFLVRDDPQGKIAINICALAVFLLFFGVGFFQPVLARFKARRYRRKALRIPEPRVWFASDGVYHEAFGYTSLKELIKVTDQTKSRKSIQFTLMVSTDETSTHAMPYSFPVPAGCEEQAAQLVRRYRQDRLH